MASEPPPPSYEEVASASFDKPAPLPPTRERDVPPGYELKGERYCVVTKTLAPGEEFHAERGSLNFMTPGVKIDTKWQLRGLIGGEAVMKAVYTNTTGQDAHLGIATNAPMAGVVPIRMDEYNGQLTCKQGAWLASTPGVTLNIGLVAQRPLAVCCGGMPPIVQTVQATQPGQVVLLSGGGTVIRKKLAAGEQMLVETGSIVAFSQGVEFDVRYVGSLLTCCCAGEGLFNTQLTGPGEVYLQTSSWDKMTSLFMHGRRR